jgi:hypothetical protein
MNNLLAANEFAAVPAQVVIIVIAGAILSICSYAVKILIKQNVLLDRLIRVVFPDNKPPLDEQLEIIRDDVKDIKRNGSDRLEQILDETRLQRVENARERQRLIRNEREIASKLQDEIKRNHPEDE